MQFWTVYKIAMGILALVVIGGAVWFIRGIGAPAEPPIKNLVIDPNATSTTVDGYTIKRIDDESVQQPSLDRAITVSATLSPEAKEILQTQIKAKIGEIKAAPDRVDLWLTLGSLRKMAGDYAGAVEIWDYVTVVSPADLAYVAYGNLGDLYMNFLHDYPKAEARYLKVVELKPHYVDSYRNLYTLYRYLYKQGTGADMAILEQGLKNNPDDAGLLALKAQAEAR